MVIYVESTVKFQPTNHDTSQVGCVCRYSGHCANLWSLCWSKCMCCVPFPGCIL